MRAQLMDLRAREHQLRSQALDALVAQALLEKEAEARGMTPEALHKAEVEDKAVVTDADAKAYYAANKARFGTTSEAEALEQIKAGLGQQRQNERRAAFARELRAKYDVKVLLEPYRVPVEVGSAPVRGNPKAPGHDRRVLGLPVPVLRARAAHGHPGARGLRRQGALRLPPLPPRLPRPGGEGRRGRGLRRRAGEVLGDARPALGEHREAAGRRPQGPRRDARPRRGGLRPVPRLGPPRRPRRGRPRGRPGLRRLGDPGVLRQRPAARRRAAVRGLRAGDRRRAARAGDRAPAAAAK